MDPPADAELATVVGLELALLDPAVRADPDRVAALLHAGFVEVGASGRRWDHAATVAELAARPGDPMDPTRATDVEAVRLGPDAILVTYRSERPGAVAWRSSIWVRAGGGWVVRYHEGTPAAGPAGPSGDQRP